MERPIGLTVGELRALLAELPYDMPVAVDAYEEGMTVSAVRIRTVQTKWSEPPRHSSQGELVDIDQANQSWRAGPDVLLVTRRDEDE